MYLNAAQTNTNGDYTFSDFGDTHKVSTFEETTNVHGARMVHYVTVCGKTGTRMGYAREMLDSAHSTVLRTMACKGCFL